MKLYVGYSYKDNNFNTIYDALLSIDATFADRSEETITKTFSDKEFPAKKSSLEPATIYIANGVYREKLVITRPNLTLIGESKDTIIEYGDGAFDDMEDGSKRGTFRTATVRIDTHDFTANNITFKNTAGTGSVKGQALALYIDGDRNIFDNCAFIGNQDTLFTAPLPEKEAKPGGFKGPGEAHKRYMGRHLYKNCYIEGNVDFIFGGAISIFDKCVIFSKNPGDKPLPENDTDEVILGYITAASTPKGEPFGYVFFDCKLESDCPPNTVYLGRPWREYAKTVFIRCELGSHIHKHGWLDWNKNHDNFFYAEYKCFGDGADTSNRASFSHVLTDEEASEYTYQNIFKDWNIM